MTHLDAVALIDTPWFRDQATPMRWADLGCGSGTFTLALADLLAPGSSIEAIDLRPSIAPQTTKNGVSIHPRAADFTTLDLRLRATPGTSSGPNAASVLSPRVWPGNQPLVYDGILMANSLHYVEDQRNFLNRLHGAPGDSVSTIAPTPTSRPGALLLVEYDTEVSVARWVPYPLSFPAATRLLQSSGWPHIQKLGTQPSAFGRTELYAALALAKE